MFRQFASCLFVALSPCASLLAQQSLEPLQNVDAVSTGGAHACAVTSAGGVKCWGWNGFGQLGDGSFVNRSSPVDVVGLGSGAVAVEAGATHTCALMQNGSVKCWGGNRFGQLGDGTTTSHETPVAVVGLGGTVAAISLSPDSFFGSHSCALLESGGVQCWGANAAGQLGNGTTQQQLMPVGVSGMNTARRISAGGQHSCAVLADGTASCWGDNANGQLGDGTVTQRLSPVAVRQITGATAISAGGAHSCAIVGGGRALCWGGNGNGQLGDGNGLNRVEPAQVAGLSSGASSVSAGSEHTCAIVAGGLAKCWGSRQFNQLGDGVGGFRQLSPVNVVGLANLAAISAGFEQTCALTSSGEVACWGLNEFGQLGDGTSGRKTVPVDVEGLGSAALSVDAGVRGSGLYQNHSCAVTVQGGVKCWGRNTFGQLGDGSNTDRLSPVDVLGLGGTVLAVAVGEAHTCALRTNGSVRCWGLNFSGQLGDGTQENRPSPVDVVSLASGVAAIDAGRSHTCALMAGGGVKCWGANAYGELGLGSAGDNLATPQDVSQPGGSVTAIAVGDSHTCALLSDRGATCWGLNLDGQLGNGGTADVQATPTRVTGLADAAGLSAGSTHTCALTTAGAVKCWGDNRYAQLSDGSLSARELSPVIVPSAGTNNAALSVGGFMSCVLSSEGQLRCWGNNFNGQLGDGSLVDRTVPTPVAGLLSGVAKFSAGGEHACAVVSPGRAKCWGVDAYGQVGDGGRNYALASRVLLDKAQTQVEAATQPGNAASSSPTTDAFGRYLIFESAASNLTPGDSNGARDIFRRDRSNNEIELVSLDDAEQPIDGDSIEPSVSADGELIVFVAPDAALSKLAGESHKAAKARGKGGQFGVYLRNMLTGTTRRIATALPTGTGTTPSIAPFAGSIAFTALPTSPDQGALGQPNVFVVPLDRVGDEYFPGTPACPTCKLALTKSSDGPSSQGVLSANGDWLAFTSQATNLPGTTVTCPQASSQVYLRNMLTGQTMSASSPTSSAQCSAQGSSQPSIDWSGTAVVFETGIALAEGDRNGFSDIYLFDATQGTHERVSEDPSTGHDGLDASTKPGISGDGKVVTFQSLAKNIESSEPDNNEANDIFVRNMETEAMRRVSRSARGDQGNAESDGAALSWDGANVVFASQANNLILHPTTGQTTDTNAVQDVFETANPLVAQSKSGTWWIPAESGWGVFTIDQGNALGVGWFTYDSDGEPTWFIGAAFEQPDGRYVGEMFRQTGVPLAQISGLATETSVKFADITLQFTGSGALKFDYAVVGGVSQSKQMNRFVYNGEDIVCRTSPFSSRKLAGNASDLWWGGADTSGWGIFVNQARNVLVSTWYTYDTDREALFLTAVAVRQPDGRFTGEIYRQANGTPFNQINGAPPSLNSTVVGSVAVNLIDGETADFAYTIGSTVQTKRISRYTFGASPGACSEARP